MRRLALPIVILAALLGFGFRTDPNDITIRAYPTIVSLSQDQRVIVSGELLPPRADEYVAVEGKECGVPGAFFRSLWGASTNQGGGWEAEFYVRTKTVLHAVSGKDVSSELTVQARAPVFLAPTAGKPGRYRLATWGGAVSLAGRRVRIERFDRGTSTWKLVKTIVVEADQTNEAFRIAVPKGTTIRAVLPRSQSGPCYLAGYSKLLQT